MGKVSGDFLRFWGNSGEILEHRGEIFLEGVGHPDFSTYINSMQGGVYIFEISLS